MHAKLTGRWRGLAAVPMDNGTRTQYPQTTATPGPSKFRMQFPHDTDPCTLKNRRISTIRLQHLKYTQGNCMRNCRNPVRTQHHATTRTHRYRGAGGSAGPAAAPVDNGARPRCPWTAAAPSPSKFRMQFPHDTDPCTLKNRRISTIRLQHLKYTQGNCMRNCRNPVRTQHHATTRPHRYGERRRAGPQCRRDRCGGHGRAAAHGCIKQPGPQPGNATRSSPSAPCAQGGASRPGRNGCGPRCAAPRPRCR